MSRSYKRTPWSGDVKGKDKKRQANSKVRMFLKDPENEIQNSDFKKVSESWDICDYGWTTSWEEYWENCLKRYEKYPSLYKKPPNEKEEYRRWYKWFKMK